MKLLHRLTAGMLALSMAVSGFCPLPAAAVAQDEAQWKEYAEIIVSSVNDARRAEGLRELYIAPVLMNYAQVRAEELPVQFSHTRPDGSSCFSVMKDDGFFYNVAAENIAAGNSTPAATFTQWMNSEAHRSNIMGADFTHIGIGYWYEPDSTFHYHWSMFLVGVYDGNATPVTFEGQYKPERVAGDVDGSKTVTVEDANMILEYASNWSAGTDPAVSDAFMEAADVNGDGLINAVDASIVMEFAAASAIDPAADMADYIW